MARRDPFDHYLLVGERKVLHLTYHWMFLAKPVLRLAAAVAVAILLIDLSDGATFAWWLFWLAAAGFGIPLLTAVEQLKCARFIITENRVVFVTGWLNKRYGMMPLLKITDLTIEEPVLGRIFGYGTLVAESAGQDQAFHRVPYLPEPHDAWRIISNLLYEQGADGFTRPSLAPEPTSPIRRQAGED